jgi:hypothetical protein
MSQILRDRTVARHVADEDTVTYPTDLDPREYIPKLRPGQKDEDVPPHRKLPKVCFVRMCVTVSPSGATA